MKASLKISGLLVVVVLMTLILTGCATRLPKQVKLACGNAPYVNTDLKQAPSARRYYLSDGTDCTAYFAGQSA